MTKITISRTASAAEIVAEMDRRGQVIEHLEAEMLKVRPFSYYPENRDELLSLARILQNSHDTEGREAAADKLSDAVIAILEDEQFVLAGYVKVPEFTNPDGPTAA
jgi:hypothetical protein